ncbi:MAG: hypothetical protein ACYS9Y_08355 [Planctomycetota bacterium]|jgi:hypothetical protein
MKTKTNFTKKDFIVTFTCVLFLLANIAAIGTSGRRRAKEAVCLSNLQNWGNIFKAFLNDNEGYFMDGYSDITNQRWYLALRPYYSNNEEFLLCPQAVKPLADYGFDPSGGTFNTWDGGTHDGQQYYGSYGICSCLLNPPTQSSDHWRRADVAGADNVPLLLDAQWFTAYPWWSNEPPFYEGARWRSGATGGGMGIYCIPRHYGAINGLFLDFSARKIGLKELWLLKWTRTYDVSRASENEPDWNISTGWMVPLKDYDYTP